MRRLAVFLLLASLVLAEERRTFAVPIHRQGVGCTAPCGKTLVSVAVEGVNGTFVLDTGADVTVISPRLAANGKDRQKWNLSGLNGRETVDSVIVVLKLGGDKMRARVMTRPLDNVSKMVGTAIDGVLGLDVLGSYSHIEIDLKAQTLTLTRGN
jgi:hypothetical protein